jgi:hypothetical protein
VTSSKLGEGKGLEGGQGVVQDKQRWQLEEGGEARWRSLHQPRVVAARGPIQHGSWLRRREEEKYRDEKKEVGLA